MLSRRIFLRNTSFALGSLTAVRMLAAQSGGSNAVFTNPENTFLATHGMLTQDAFTRQVGSIFHVVLADRTRVPMRLTEVSSLAKLSTVNAVGVGSQAATHLQAGLLRGAGSLRASGALIGQTAGQAAGQAALQGGFRVTFELQGGVLAQGSYVVESGVYGPGVMFLVPGANSGGSNTCTAVFVKSGSA